MLVMVGVRTEAHIFRSQVEIGSKSDCLWEQLNRNFRIRCKLKRGKIGRCCWRGQWVWGWSLHPIFIPTRPSPQKEVFGQFKSYGLFGCVVVWTSYSYCTFLLQIVSHYRTLTKRVTWDVESCRIGSIFLLT